MEKAKAFTITGVAAAFSPSRSVTSHLSRSRIRIAMAEAEKCHWRDGRWYWAAVALVILATASLAAYEIWMRQSLSELTDRDIYEFSGAKLFCNNEHFWGQEIRYISHRDGNPRLGVLCRDWFGQKWMQRNED
jgi:hypothetical protein